MLKLNDLASLSKEDLIDEYEELCSRHQQLLKTCENDAQRIHELKRSLETATAAETYLAQELEQLSSGPDKKLEAAVAACDKTQSELKDLQRQCTSLEADKQSLLEQNEALLAETEELRIKVQLNEAAHNNLLPTADELAMEERLDAIERENTELLQHLEEFNESRVRYTMTIAEQTKNIEILRDHVNCLEENMKIKRNELEEKNQLLECTQEQLMEANAKIAMLTTAPETNDSKGNSLFAEVDDQRQAMRHLLAAQKKSYLQMKKVFNESEYEIRRLKRENIAMHTELQACSAIFCNADKTYQDKLKVRINQLVEENEEMERNLNWTQQKLKELAGSKGVLCFDTMLSFCKQETCELKKKLHSERIKKASVDEQLRNSEQNMARWRFESLKSRCILLNREDLLNEHKIAFKPNNTVEFHISQTQLENARPRILNEQIKTKDESTKIVQEKAVEEFNNILELTTEKETQLKKEIMIEQSAGVQTQNKTETTENKENFEITCPGTSPIKDEKVIEQSENKTTFTENKEYFETTRPETSPIKEEKVIEQMVPMQPQNKTEIKANFENFETTSPGTPLIEKETAVELSVPLQLQNNTKFIEDKEKIEITSPEKSPIKEETAIIEQSVSLQSQNNTEFIENKENIETTSPGTQLTEIGSPNNIGIVRRSILCKERDIFAKPTNKHVQFSAEAARVYNLSPVVVREVCSNVTVKQVSSSVVVRHFKFNPKQENIND